ncbi:TolC family protein [Celeribacter indicus]|uniref:Outer membrane efflux protein n=1 Tax=Celeribacter indicus TaxID=1208324 RepID=A0A0B5E624_9RHOB|nr:TolC family protein [Celeribacter indicus]AJE48855.1 hypothetical protein P73_4140 [Celeribacter indicus]SDW39259.1 outer membrane protein, adhesin transport system [Celeribacter indicus]
MASVAFSSFGTVRTHISTLTVFFTALFGLSVLCSSAAAQMSLQEAVLLSTSQDPGLAALRQEVAVRSVDIQAARDAYFPSISLSGESSTTDSNGAGATLSVEQVLFDWGLTRGRIDEASHARVKAITDLKAAIEDLTFEIAGFFLDVEVMDKKLAFTRQYLEFARRLSSQAEDRARAGVSDNSEVARARLEIARAEDQYTQILANRQIAMSQLDFLVGQPVGSVSVPPALGFENIYATQGKIDAAVRISPQYIAARAKVLEAEAGIGVAKAARLPTIKLQAQARTDLNGGDTQTALGISAGVDLSSRSFGQREIQSARLALDGAKSSLDATERQLRNTAASALERLELLTRSEVARGVQLTEAEKVLNTYEDQFIAGRREILDLLTTGRDLYDAQIDQVDAYDERKRTEYESAKDLGVLGTLLQAQSGTL